VKIRTGRAGRRAANWTVGVNFIFRKDNLTGRKTDNVKYKLFPLCCSLFQSWSRLQNPSGDQTDFFFSQIL